MANLAQQKQQALSLYQQQRFQEARKLLKQICKQDKQDADSCHLLAAVNLELDNTDQALKSCHQALKINPQDPDILCTLGVIQEHRQQYDEARQAYQEALSLDPGNVNAQFNLGNAYLALGEYKLAELSFRQSVRLLPSDPENHYKLGVSLQLQGDFQLSEKCFNQAIKLRPGFTEARLRKGNDLLTLGSPAGAIKCFEEALKSNAESTDAHYMLGIALFHTGETEKALQHINAALKMAPDHKNAIAEKINILNKLHKFEEALSLLRPHIDKNKMNPALAFAYNELCQHAGDCNEATDIMEHFADREFSPQERNDVVNIHYALGKRYDKSGEYERAFKHYETANNLKLVHFSMEEHSRNIDTFIQFYNATDLSATPAATIPSDQLIFIVGMPRSGTTLTEQILSSHPKVNDAGELPYIGKLHKRVTEYVKDKHKNELSKLTAKECDLFANEYHEKVATFLKDAPMVTDKMPGNYNYLGLIQLLFPQAKIIHCQRNPIDTCLSIYFQNFIASHGYACDMTKLGHVYKEYLRLMEYWKETLRIPIYDMVYEDVINDQEQQTRALLDFCGLEWDEACLDFHQSGRLVLTTSYDQVRQPLYSGSVGRWKHYEKYIGPLIEALK